MTDHPPTEQLETMAPAEFEQTDGRPTHATDVGALRTALQEALEANRAQMKLLATIAHDMKGQLQGIIGFTTLLLNGEIGGVSQGQRKALEIVKRESDDLLALVRDVLDFGVFQGGTMRLEVKSLGIAQLLRELRESLVLHASARGLQLPPVECDEAMRVLADPLRLRQAIRNLMSNAIAYTNRGHVKVRVVTEARFARIEVIDTGIGIPAEQMHKVFDEKEFIRREAGRRGTGLGLAITRRMVDLMGGTVGAISDYGLGSTFWVTIPLADRSPADQR